MTDLQKWLDEAEWAKKWGTADRNVRLEEAVAALRAVVELHQPGPGGIEPLFCVNCDHAWPCPTIRAIKGKVLNGESE